MELRSNAIVDGQPIPLKYAELSAGGQNVSPDLRWSGAPEGTQSFAVMCFDPDAPTGSGWWHWIGWEIGSDVTSLTEGAEFPGREWANDYGYEGWGGPCPPPGAAHRYQLTIHALDQFELPIGADLTSAAVRFTLLSHSLDSATITGTFALPEAEQL